MTVEYEPVDTVTVDGDAAQVDSRLESIPVVDLVGSVASVDGKVSHIVVDSDLDQSALDSIVNEFGSDFQKVEE